MNKAKTRRQLKEKLYDDQGGLCAFCGRGRYCPDCEDGKAHKLNPDGTDKHRFQKVGWLDHNHSHKLPNGKECNGCSLCVRGVVHNMCNWNVIPVLQRNPQLQNDTVKKYMNRGTVSDEGDE